MNDYDFIIKNKGRDILVVLEISDGVETFERRWVVQCKFLVLYQIN